MNNKIYGRIMDAFARFEREQGLAIKYNPITGGKPLLAPTKVVKRKGTYYIHGTRGMVTKTTDLSLWYGETMTLLRKYLLPADIKAIWKQDKIAKFQKYT